VPVLSAEDTVGLTGELQFHSEFNRKPESDRGASFLIIIL